MLKKGRVFVVRLLSNPVQSNPQMGVSCFGVGLLPPVVQTVT
jgi:hypothetical protein